MPVRRGGCACGAVRYAVKGKPVKVGLCHCTDCRKETGSAFLYYADWPSSAFSSTGEFATFEGRSFCPQCGSRLFHLGEDGDHVEICVGSLDAAPAGLTPTREGWIKRREHWLDPVAGSLQGHEHPPP